MGKRKAMILFEADLQRLEAIRRFIFSNLDKRLDIAYIATNFGMGQSTLRRHFKQYYRKSLYHFVHECRMKKAMELVINHHATISQIASSLSYKNLSSFTRAFSKYYQRTPLHYMKATRRIPKGKGLFSYNGK